MKIDDVKVTKEFDRRRKLTDEQKDEIRKRYEMENTSLQKLADEYSVSKSLILIIVNPERAEAVRETNREYSVNNKVSSKQRAEYMRRHRKYKRELIEQGKLRAEG